MAPPLRADEGAGYWSPRTANIDWCESNYEVSIAESGADVDTLRFKRVLQLLRA